MIEDSIIIPLLLVVQPHYHHKRKGVIIAHLLTWWHTKMLCSIPLQSFHLSRWLLHIVGCRRANREAADTVQCQLLMLSQCHNCSLECCVLNQWNITTPMETICEWCHLYGYRHIHLPYGSTYIQQHTCATMTTLHTTSPTIATIVTLFQYTARP